ncbi:hypothetical protein JZ751_018488 [Albula glossodonta]|uniref:VWFD domain-containing protein n=1 Tax=Albula glossodonta TaxID=121402 RepID=A0A8T2NQ80_9TELE|nr:hypothetical protein JZ751_018488 [Albula glossodonta]
MDVTWMGPNSLYVYPPEANDSCDVAHCDRDQMCWIRDGLPVCLPKMKLCSAWGGSHLHTFSGRAFDFHGTCTYVLAQAPCPGSSSVSNAVAVYISGAAAGVGNATVTSFDRVNVNIQDLNITMIKGALQHVMVNGLRHRLPISLSGSLRLFPSGSSVILETGLGLVLKYDWLHHLAVHASLELSRTMCGLCSGSSRDFSSGLPALGPKVTATDAEVVEFVRSWKTGSDGAGSCRDDCGSSCPSCKPEHLETALVAQACRLLRDPKGPFTDCLKTVDPAPYIRACEADVCVRGGDPAAACDALKTFTDACQGSGVTVSAWRALANCCDDPDAPSRCQLSCSETCQCNEGFLLSGRECVPPRQCGCTHGGSYRLPNESFWADRSCQQRCTCDPASRHTTCTPVRCPHGEECVLEAAGTYGCQRGTHGLCLVQGDPHYTTFDGRRFDFEGTCIYLLAAHCPSTGSLPNFRIEVQNEKRDGKGASYSKVIKMQVHGYNIQISWDQMDRVLVNSLLLRLPSVLSLGKVKMYKTGLSLYVECDFGLVLSYNWNNLVTLAMPMAFSGATCGICGNFNGDKNDDLVPPEGPGPHHSDALTQWKTGVIPGCTDITPRDPFRCPDQKSGALSSVEHCGMLTDPNGPFRDCHGAVDPLPSFENCVSDVCLNGSQIILCQMIASYVAACQDAGAKVRNWRSSQFCELSCPANSRYVLCSSPLPHACVEPPSPNGAMCREDCECVQGFFRSGDRCVPDSECGCQRDGVYHQSGDTFYLDELCQEECTCKGHGLVQCRKSSCPIGTQCDIRNGTRNCHPTPGTGRCSLSGELHYHTFDGHVNGVLWKLPALLGQVRVLQHGLRTQVETDAGVALSFDMPHFVQVTVPHAYAGHLCGLCGDFNGNATDDHRLRDGTLTLNLVDLGTSWSVPQPKRRDCTDGCGNNCPVCNASEAEVARFSSEEYCGLLSAPSGPFQACLSTVDPRPHFNSCLHDLCVSHGDREKCCSSLRAYAIACQEAGARLQSWRNSSLCTVNCPANSQYSVCVDTCAETCVNVSSNLTCRSSCAEGCQCSPGFRTSVDRCVKEEECGCFQEGRYYEVHI